MRLPLALTASLFATFLAFSTGCGSSKSIQTGTMSVMSTVPAAGATMVNTTAAIQITFSVAADPTTVNSANIQVADSSMNVVAGAVTYSATSNVATFTPTAALAADVMFTVTITGVTSSSGAAMAAPFTTTFTTAPAVPAQYQVSLFGNSSLTSNGQVSVDANGMVTVQLAAATASTTFSVQFCPAYAAGGPTIYTCFAVGSVTSDASGNANTTMAFPQSGSWAGDFEVSTGSTDFYATNLLTGTGTPVYVTALQRTSTVNGQGIGDTATSQAPLTSGTVTFSNGTLQFVLAGTSPNTFESAVECGLPVGTSSCYALYSSTNLTGFTTDGSGDVTFSVLPDGLFGDMLSVNPTADSAGFIGGFVVPSAH